MIEPGEGHGMDDDEFERVPPGDTGAEKWCLGGLMRSAEALTEVAEILEPDDWLRPAHQIVYAAMITLHAQGIPVDPITVKAELEERGEIGRMGGPVELANMY